ncbi:MAG: hypothetical protein AAF517_20985, partial [Planctomycetota bacterium]
MSRRELRVAGSRIVPASGEVRGSYVDRGGERFYRIENYDQMDPFFMSLVSSSNLWVFLSSLGGLTAGRQDSESSLFPYYTEDKIHDNSGNTGPRTVLHVEKDGDLFLWEPFGDVELAFYRVSRNLYKNVVGNKITFEERNEDLELAFRYSWWLS